MTIRQNFMPYGHASRSHKPLGTPTSITLHWVGPYPGQTPDIVRDWWLESGASAHYVIKDYDILQTIPEQEAAWHCGCIGNYNSIGIEVIPKNTEGEFSEESIYSIIYLLKRLPKVEIKRHYDWTVKDCPKFYTPYVEDGEDEWKKLCEILYTEREKI